MKRILLVALLLASIPVAGAEPLAPNEPSNVTAARLNSELAIGYLKQNDVATAQQKIDKALTQNPRDSAVQMSAALVYERLQQPDKADGFYAAALRLEPHSPDVQNNYAVFQCRRGRYAQGQKLFEQAAANPAYSTPEVALANAGVCARTAGNLPVAEQLLRRALAIRNDFPDALLQLADVTFARGQGLASRAFLERYFAVSPATPEALALAIKVEQSLGDAAAVKRYAGQLTHDFPDSAQARQQNGGTDAQ